jgi:hypothetical protein
VLVIHRGAPPAVAGPLNAAATRELRARSLEFADTEGVPRVLEPADEILFACAMGARTLPVQTCQWLVDVYRILHSPEAPTPDSLLERARRARLVPQVSAAVRYLAEIAGDEVLQHHLTVLETEPIGPRDRIAFALAGVSGSRLTGTAQVLALYLQTTGDDPPLRAVARLPRHLQERWEVESLAGLPFVALQKTLRPRKPQAGSSAPERNRSASS